MSRKTSDQRAAEGIHGPDYEHGELIPAPEPRGTEKGSDFPLPEDGCTMGAPASADEQPEAILRRRRAE